MVKIERVFPASTHHHLRPVFSFTQLLNITISNMIRSAAFKALPTSSRHAAMPARAFASSTSAHFASPAEGAPPPGKSPKMKEFKIYRWVRLLPLPYLSTNHPAWRARLTVFVSIIRFSLSSLAAIPISLSEP